MSCLCGSSADEPTDAHWAPETLPEQPPLLGTYARAHSLRSTFIEMSDGVKIAVDVTLPLVRLAFGGDRGGAPPFLALGSPELVIFPPPGCAQRALGGSAGLALLVALLWRARRVLGQSLRAAASPHLCPSRTPEILCTPFPLLRAVPSSHAR